MNIRLEDLPKDTHQLVEIVGMEKMIEIVKCYGGDTLYLMGYTLGICLNKYLLVDNMYL